MRVKALGWDLVYTLSILIQMKLENANLVSLFLNVFWVSPTLKQQQIYSILLSPLLVNWWQFIISEIPHYCPHQLMRVDGRIKPFTVRNITDVGYLVFRLKHSPDLQLSLQLVIFYFRIQVLPLSKLSVYETKVVVLFSTHWGHTGNLS